MEINEIISSGLPELYAMGLTTEEETVQVEQWARQYPEVQAEILSIQAGLENYAKAHALEPSALVKDKLLKRIQAESSKTPVVATAGSVAPVRSISSFWKYAAAASIILLIGSGILNYQYYNKYKSASNELQSAQTELQQQKDIVAAMHDDMGVMTDKNAVPVSLDPMPDVPEAAARIYWVKNTKEVYIDPSNLPKAPDGMQYQFWGIVDGKPVSGGMINTTINGKTVHIQKMKSFGRAEAFAVSLEKAGPEAPAPTRVFVMGKII